MIRLVNETDKVEWFMLDKHLSEEEFNKKVRDKQGYVLIKDITIVGVLRYSLFWDSIPFMNMLYISDDFQNKGYGRKLCLYFENEMKSLGHGMVLTSTQSDETAIHFYHKIGYETCGYIDFNIEGYIQPREIVLSKKI